MINPETIIAHLSSFGNDPVVLVVVILAATLVLEDAATIGAAMLAADGALSVSWASTALFAGIVLGDLGLYGLGWLAARNAWFRGKLQERVALDLRHWMGRRLVPIVFGARFIPGARLPAYTASGLLGLPFWRFTAAAAGATALWTALVFTAVFLFGVYLVDDLGPWRWVLAGGLALTLLLVSRVRSGLRIGI